MQYYFKDVLVIWGCVSLMLLMYYVYSLEIQNGLDTLTKIKNRESFEQEMHYLLGPEKKDSTIFVFDLNNLKNNNDTLGHPLGDAMLITVARILDSCFKDIGNVYRIGGDEFCVICKAMNNLQAQNRLSLLQDTLTLENKKDHPYSLMLAHGFATSKKSSGFGIEETFSKADDLMYAYKAKTKALLSTNQINEIT